MGDREGMYALNHVWSGLVSAGDEGSEPEVGSECIWGLSCKAAVIDPLCDCWPVDDSGVHPLDRETVDSLRALL
jgi:hypothetical protein